MLHNGFYSSRDVSLVLQCSKSCGGGAQYRDAVCMNAKNETVADSQCRGSKDTSRRCNKAPCPVWQLGDWTQVSDMLRNYSVDIGLNVG